MTTETRPLRVGDTGFNPFDPPDTPREPAPALSPEWQELADRPPLYRFPFPLRDGMDVSLALPRDLTVAEAERLAVFIRTLALPEAAS